MIKLSDFFNVVGTAWHLSVILMCFSFSKNVVDYLFLRFYLLSCDTSLYILPVFLLGCWHFSYCESYQYIIKVKRKVSPLLFVIQIFSSLLNFCLLTCYFKNKIKKFCIVTIFNILIYGLLNFSNKVFLPYTQGLKKILQSLLDREVCI